MYKLPKTLDEDISRFKILLKECLEKEIESVQFRAFRVLMGIYEQRKNETYMLRVRTTGGVIYPEQFLKLIEIASKHSSNLLHITTRQEIQIQNLQLEEIPSILSELKEIGLATKGGGGNTIRNILVSSNSGISKNEVFDTTPHAMSLTTKLMTEPDSYLLPRKMKIAFSSCEEEKNYAAVNDMGFVAKKRKEKRGFQVYVGGGGGADPSVGWVIFNFIPENELFIITEAVKKMFFERGNRRNKHKARIRYIFYKLGVKETICLIKQYYEDAKKTTAFFVMEKNEKHFISYVQSSYLIVVGKEYETWKRRYVNEQRQVNYVSVIIPFEYGNISLNNNRSVKDIKNLLSFVAKFGRDTIRFTTTQNIQLRNIPDIMLPKLYLLVKKVVLEPEVPLLVNNIVSCTGSDTCRLGVCLSKGLAFAIRNELKNASINLDRLKNARIHISGCLNSCGQQLLADIGFAGKILRNQKFYPGYQVYLAADRVGKSPKLAKSIGSIPARDIPKYLIRLLNYYLNNSSNDQDLTNYLQKEGKKKAISLLKEYQNFSFYEMDKDHYYDWGSEVPFSFFKRGLSECSAGLFDIIEADLKHIREVKKSLETETDKQKIHELLHDVMYFSSHMLLLTMGVEPKTKKDAFRLLLIFFFDKGLIKKKYRFLIEELGKNELMNLTVWEKNIYSFLNTAMELYNNMDDSLQYKNVQQTIVEEISKKRKFKDLRGTVCPMNFVQTKIQLAQMESSEELEIWIDDGYSIRNVPASIKNEGHEILDQILVENYWKVVIKKK